MIVVRNLTKRFGRQLVLDHLSFEVPRGTTAVIMGGSGAGKSVLLRHINGLLRPDEGEVVVDGVNVSTLAEDELSSFRLRVGMVFQGSALFDSMTVGDNVAFALREHTRYPEARIREIVTGKLALMGLRDVEHKMPAELSGGMQKRVAIARAIAVEPEVMLYDEPTAGLDPMTAAVISNLILRLQNTIRATAVAVTHDMNTAFKIADRIFLLKCGKFVAEGTPEEIRRNPERAVQDFIMGEAPEEEKVTECASREESRRSANP